MELVIANIARDLRRRSGRPRGEPDDVLEIDNDGRRTERPGSEAAARHEGGREHAATQGSTGRPGGHQRDLHGSAVSLGYPQPGSYAPAQREQSLGLIA